MVLQLAFPFEIEADRALATELFQNFGYVLEVTENEVFLKSANHR